jgi:hypothetical protein
LVCQLRKKTFFLEHGNEIAKIFTYITPLNTTVVPNKSFGKNQIHSVLKSQYSLHWGKKKRLKQHI